MADLGIITGSDGRLGTAFNLGIPIYGGIDKDNDGLNDDWENSAISSLRPNLVFDENEDNLQNNRIAIFTRVTPLSQYGQDYIVFLNTIAFDQDNGTAIAGLAPHKGDTEQFQTIWKVVDNNTIQLAGLRTSGHKRTVIKERIKEPFKRFKDIFKTREVFSKGESWFGNLQEIEISNDGQINIYIEEDKHGTWPTKSICEKKSRRALDCGGGEIRRPPAYNVGEPHSYSSFTNQLKEWWPGELVWDDPDGYFLSKGADFIGSKLGQEKLDAIWNDYKDRNLNFIEGDKGNNQIFGTDKEDVVFGYEGNDEIFGGNGYDFIYGDEGQDTLYGGIGNDTLDGRNGDDTIYGEDGNDILYGGEGFDFIYGDEGQDTLYGWTGNDTLDGRNGDDTIYGEDGDDILYGGEGFDFIYGDEGQDTLYGWTGDDTLDGRNGDDTIYGEDGNDILYGGEGFDFIYGDEGQDTLYGWTGDDTLDGRNGDDTIYGEDGNDILYGGEGFDFIYGDEGQDTLYGWTGDDTLDGRNGDDTIYGEDGNDILYGGEGFDFIYGDEGQDTLYGWTGDDTLDGRNGDDTIYGEDGNDILYGGEGFDFIYGDEGQDTLYGWTGDDTLDGRNGDDIIYGEAGNDILYGGEGSDRAEYQTANAEVVADLNLGIVTTTDAKGNTEEDTLISIEQLSGSNYDDRLIGDGQDNTLVGNNGNDTLVGNAGADVLDGGEGIDRAEFFTANAAIVADLNLGIATTTDAQGNTEEDTLIGIEQVFGSNFDDKLTGDAQENILTGNKGNDSLWGGAGNDNLRGDEGADVLDGGEGIDRAEYWSAKAGVVADLNLGTATIINAAGNSEVDTLISIEQLYGSSLNDQLVGDDLSNALVGRDGDDVLLGGKGDDVLEGGNGADSFAFTFPDQGVDRINDFNSTEGDKIQISANGFGGNLIPGSLDAEQFVLGTASVDGDDRFIFNQDTGRLSFDADGSGVLEAVEIATFYNNTVLSNADIFIV